ncbi:VOC family protein [Devosia sp. BK]|uniref:VOC family protein n=1 Tax=Devosia sp. BK TaxID=2871706 RepID=UPI00293B0825|nr:VOC family protein [Devosia sp. BK]MDV3252056.1 VOC family protein [Devosia sp. BK]
MNVTRRHILRLAGASTASAALAGAIRAEGGNFSILPDYQGMFATSTPLHVRDVTLKVRDLETMIGFYTEIIGLAVLDQAGASTRLGVDGITLLTLEHHPEGQPEGPMAAGLYHTAFLLPSRADLASWLIHTAMAQYQFRGFADHRVSEAVYLDDPEGNGVEVYADRDPAFWTWDGTRIVMGSEAIDFDGLLALTDTQSDTFSAAPSGTRIGHIHLRAGNIPAAGDFYGVALGLDTTSGREDALFLSSGRYHHHVALNTWESLGAGQRNAGATGLAGFTLSAIDEATLNATRERLAAAGIDLKEEAGSLTATDPWGTLVTIAKA